MSTPVAPSYDLKNGQLRNVLLATFISTIGFWAWTIVGPLAKMYAKQMHLDAGMTSLLVAMPIFIGAIGRIPVGGLTDRYGGRIMFTPGLPGWCCWSDELAAHAACCGVLPGYCGYRVRCGYSLQFRMV